MTPPHPHGSAPLASACPGECVAAQAGAPRSGALSSPAAVASPDAATHGTRVWAPNTERHGVLPHSCLATTPAAPSAGDFSDDLLTIARVERLVLLMDAHRARKRHASTRGIMRRLRDVTARLAGAGV